ncbi:MAG: hypothetical protein ACJASL_000749, partial [Paraglaciecola sp.]
HLLTTMHGYIAISIHILAGSQYERTEYQSINQNL